MNLNEPIRNAGRPGAAAFDRRKVPVMGAPKQRAPKSKSDFSSSKFSELPWGKSHESLVLNSSSNKKSTSSRSTTDIEEDKIIVALTEGRGEARCEVGLAAVNVSRPALILCQTSDSQSYNNTLTKLNIFNPYLIIYPATFDTGKENRLIAKIRKHFSSRKLVTIPRKAFSKANGLERLYKICIQTCFPLLIMIKNRYYALAAASGLLTYLQDNMFIYYASNSIKLEYQTSEGYAIIDIATADRLELVCSNQPAQANRYSSLFGIMNRCLTRIGTRNLRSIILQPLYSSDKINERLDCVQELIRNPGILLAVQGVLPKLSSIDQLLSISTLVTDDPQSCNNRQLNYLLLLNSVLETIQPLEETLKNATHPFFIELSELLNHQDFEIIKTMLRETIHESAYFAKGQQAEQQRIWAIKPGLNGLLDLVRKTYSERIEDMREYIKRLGQKYDFPLVLANNNKKGFHITMALNQNQKRQMKSSDLPPEFIQVFRLANSFTMKTVELVNLTTRIDDILTDLFSLSNIMIHDITVKVKKYVGLFYQLVEGISYLDVLQSLAQSSYANGWIRPKFGEYTNVVEGHHPLLNFLCQKTPIPNPVTACNHYNMHIITGPNGAGKSIFIRQVMLLQIMAQAGCFVPAESAIFRTADKMFARISNDDDMESSASSFVLEMNEIDYILATMTDRSLIIIDELCRSTSLEEGISIAMSICELLAQSQAFTFVTTHFTLLTKLADLHFNIKVWQLQTIPSGDTNNPKSIKLDFKFKLAQDATTLRDYGIYMVRGIWPPELMEMVDNLQRQLKKKSEDPQLPSIDHRARLRYDLNCKIQKLKLQNKFSIANVNTLINEYNESKQKIDSYVAPYSPNMMEILQQSEDGNAIEMNHSIFDGSHIQETSTNQELFLENISKGINIANESDFYAEIATNNSLQNIQDILYTTELSSQNCETASQVKTRMEQIFTPNTKLDVSEVASNANGLELRGIVNYSQSQCSLDLTQNALRYGTNKNSPTNKTDANILNCYGSSVNIFQEPQQGFLDSIPTSQLSSHELSQQLQRIRQNEGYPAAVEASPFVFGTQPSQSRVIQTACQVPQSPYITDFASFLQDNTRKTSTPILTQNQTNARNLGNTTSTFTITNSSVLNVGANVARVITPKFNLTIRGDVGDLDMSSVVEDFVSFAEEIEANEIEDVDNKSEAFKHQHIFPDIKIRDSAVYSRSEEDSNSFIDPGQIIKPTLKVPRSQVTTMESTEHPDKQTAMYKVLQKSQSQVHDITKAIESSDRMEIFEKGQNSKVVDKPQPEKNSRSIPDEMVHTKMESLKKRPRKRFKKTLKNKLKLCPKKGENRKISPNKLTAALKRLMINKMLSREKRKAISGKSVTTNKSRYELKLKRRSLVATQTKLEAEMNILKQENSKVATLDKSTKETESSENSNNRIIEKFEENRQKYSSMSDLSYSPLVPRSFNESSNKEILEDKFDDDINQVNTSGPSKILVNQYCENNIKNSNAINDKADIEHVVLAEAAYEKSKLMFEQVDTSFNQNEAVSHPSSQNRTHSYESDLDRTTEPFFYSEAPKFIQHTNPEQVKDKNLEFHVRDIENQQQSLAASENDANKSQELIKLANNDSNDSNINKKIDSKSKNEQTNNESHSSLQDGIRARTIEEYKEALEKQRKHKKIDENGSQSDYLEANHTVDASLRDLKILTANKRPCHSDHANLSNSQENLSLKRLRLTLANEHALYSVTGNSSQAVGKRGESSSLSEASKLRNLDADFSRSSSEVKIVDLAVHIVENSSETTDKSPSATSNELNLKNADSITVNKPLERTSTRKIIKKFNPPLKKTTTRSSNVSKKCTNAHTASFEERRNVESTLSNSDSTISKTSKPLFVYPSKLSQKAIRQEFLEQDKKFFDFNSSSSDLTKMWEERLKRPSRPTPKQIQQTTCLATIKKTKDGLQVIPAPKEEVPVRKRSLQKTTSFQNSNSVNMNIFSDQNAETFDQFIKSNHNDYKRFNFKFGQSDQVENTEWGNMFDFKQVNKVSSEYTQSSQSWTFVRKRSNESNCFNQFGTVTNLTPSATPALNLSLTPDGFYKRNKPAITSLLKKYEF